MEYVAQANTNYLYHGSSMSMPKYVGAYQLGGKFGLRIMFQEKPNWLHRTMMKLCLGIVWIDTTN